MGKRPREVLDEPGSCFQLHPASGPAELGNLARKDFLEHPHMGPLADGGVLVKEASGPNYWLTFCNLSLGIWKLLSVSSRSFLGVSILQVLWSQGFLVVPELPHFHP